jgi:hypothetical protein
MEKIAAVAIPSIPNLEVNFWIAFYQEEGSGNTYMVVTTTPGG